MAAGVVSGSVALVIENAKATFGAKPTPNAIKAMLQEWDRKFPGRLETIFSAVQTVVPSHLADTQLFDFKSLTQMSEQERAQAGMKLDLVNLG